MRTNDIIIVLVLATVTMAGLVVVYTLVNMIH